MNQPPPQKNPNREQSIKAMIIAGLITLFLVVMRIATLGGDNTQTAFGKALVVVPLLILILGGLAAIYYYQEVWLSYMSNLIPAEERAPIPTSSNTEPDSAQGMLKMLQRTKELQAELDETRTDFKTLQDAWDELFGPISIEEVKAALKGMYTELEALRSAESTEKMAELQQEILKKTLIVQELTKTLKESQEELTKISQHNEELLNRVNQTSLRMELLKSEKAQLVQNAKQHTWREIDWEEFMASVNYGKDLLTDNRWGERMRQRIRKEGLVLFGDPTVTSLVSSDNFPELTELNKSDK